MERFKAQRAEHEPAEPPRDLGGWEKLPYEVRRATWLGLSSYRAYLHGVDGSCKLGVDGAERLLKSPTNASHLDCLDVYVVALAEMIDPRYFSKLIEATNPAGYAFKTVHNKWADLQRKRAGERGGCTRPRRLEGPRLAVSKVLGDAWLDELASRLLEIAASGRDPLAGWPRDMLAAEKARFSSNLERSDRAGCDGPRRAVYVDTIAQDGKSIAADIESVLAVMQRVDSKWHQKYIVRPRETWGAEHPESLRGLEVGRDEEGLDNPRALADLNPIGTCAEMAAPYVPQEPQLTDLDEPFFSRLASTATHSAEAAVRAACIEAWEIEPQSPDALGKVAVHLIVERLVGQLQAIHNEESLRDALMTEFGEVAVSKLSRTILTTISKALNARRMVSEVAEHDDSAWHQSCTRWTDGRRRGS